MGRKQTKHQERSNSVDDSESNNYYDALYESDDDDDSESNEYDVSDSDQNSCDDDGPAKNNEDLTLEQKIHRATVAAGGGALVLLGICLTPVPILPVGMPTIAVGLHILGKVFDEAKQAEQNLVDTMNYIGAKLSEDFVKYHSQIENSMEVRRNELSEQGVLIYNKQ